MIANPWNYLLNVLARVHPIELHALVLIAINPENFIGERLPDGRNSLEIEANFLKSIQTP